MKTNVIIHGDCLENMRQFPDKSFDLVFYDPPYNVGKNYDGYSDKLSTVDYKKWMTTVAYETHRVSKGGICVLVPSKLNSLFYSIMPDAHLIIIHKRAAGIVSNNYMVQYYSLFSTARPTVKCRDVWDDIRLPGEGYFFREKRYDNPGLTSELLVDKILYHFSWPGDLVLDPFMGTGTTAVSCKKNGRNYVGIEQSEKYCAIAQERLNSEQV